MKASIFLPLVSVIALLATACTPKSPAPEAPAEAAFAPSEPMKAEFGDCTWGEVTAAGLTINAFACPTRKLVGDETLPGMVTEAVGVDGKITRSPTIQVFAKAADAPVDAVLAAVRAASPGAFTAECVLEANAADTSGKSFLLVPAGAGKAAYEAFRSGKSEDNSMPCGDLGPSEGGERQFIQVDGAPDKVVLVAFPSDIPLFDANTLRVAK